MRDSKGRFVKGVRSHPETEFKPGEHWRERKPYWDKEWLETEYNKGRSQIDIADQFGVTENAIHFWIKKHGIETRTMSEVRSMKHWGLSGDNNGMYGKRGEDNPNWKGGVTPERQACYSSIEWADAAREVWKRDRRCVMCGASKAAKKLHIHHIVSFAVEKLRTDPDNLVLLCVDCHNWVHSKKNIEKKFIREEEIGNDN